MLLVLANACLIILLHCYQSSALATPFSWPNPPASPGYLSSLNISDWSNINPGSFTLNASGIDYGCNPDMSPNCCGSLFCGHMAKYQLITILLGYLAQMQDSWVFGANTPLACYSVTWVYPMPGATWKYCLFAKGPRFPAEGITVKFARQKLLQLQTEGYCQACGAIAIDDSGNYNVKGSLKVDYIKSNPCDGPCIPPKYPPNSLDPDPAGASHTPGLVLGGGGAMDTVISPTWATS